MKHLGLISLLIFSLTLRAADDEAPESDADNDAEISNILNSVGYPELEVVPRASERLAMEAKAERASWFTTHWPIELSGLATLYVGTSAKGNRRENLTSKEQTDAQALATLTAATGAGWLIGGLVLGGLHPYGNAAKSIGRAKGKDERSQLFRERMAEEALERPARVMKVLQWVSVITNAGANALNIYYITDKGKMYAIAGMVFAFLPLAFTDHSIDVYDKHIEYKKKIYAPLKTSSLHYDSSSKTLTPMMNLVWAF